jgi:signal transduction histidine kinase
VRSQSLAAIGELAASVAHEIKNPLAGISGAVQILARSFAGDDARKTIALELLQQVKRLDNTVRDLLIFARPWKAQPCSFNLSAFVEGVLTRSGALDGASGLRIRKDLPAQCKIQADPQLLEHVLVNVVQNAVDAMPSGGRLSVRIQEEGENVRIEVADTGPGIAPQHQDKLFKPFFSTKSKGTGLGLAISKRLVEAHRGAICLTSEPGRGTTVRITLPRNFSDT